eukprot:TRINITY_DN5006_c0_g3_i2.p1 TRINITY_DN5006_c0_g3~~TRINITY_DN5006_c0_g3_i2.p1  ORF type:complete len:747 (+),score=100.56 TRINITY_DN5006_c0_g3_i2:105-2345(+)
MADVVIWKGNEESEKCDNKSCGRAFSLLSRRHHCRNCGGLFCGSCTQQKITIPKGENKKRRKVCKDCFTKCQANSAVAKGIDCYHSSCLIRLGQSREELFAAGYITHADYTSEGCSWKILSNPIMNNSTYYLLVSAGEPTPEAALETLFDNGMRTIETHNGITIHGAMYSLVQSQLRTIVTCIEQLPKSGSSKHVVFTGFGIGGSLATIAMLEVSASLPHSSSFVLEALTFGAPAFLASNLPDKLQNHGTIRRKITNFVLNFDLIPRMLSLPSEKQREVLKHLSHPGRVIRDNGPLYYPIGTIVFIQCSTDLPSIGFRCSCGVVQADAAAAPRNDPGMQFLRYLPLEKFNDVLTPKALQDHDLGLYFSAVRLVARTGWGCLPAKHQTGQRSLPSSTYPRGSLKNTSQRSVHITTLENTVEVKPQCDCPLQQGTNKVILETGGTGSCLVDIEGTCAVVEIDLRVRMSQHSYTCVANTMRASLSPPTSPSGSPRSSKTAFKEDTFEVCTGDVCQSPFILEDHIRHPISVRVLKGLIIVVHHNPGRPTISRPLRTLDTLTTPIRFQSSSFIDVWSVVMRFSKDEGQKCAKEYIRICFRESSQACKLYDLLKHYVVATAECDDIILSLSDLSGLATADRDRESLCSSSTTANSDSSPCAIEYSGENDCWGVTVSPPMGAVICRYRDSSLDNPEPVYDEDGNFSRSPSAATADRWLQLHFLSHRIALADYPVWRCEVTDCDHPPMLETLGK